MNKALFLVVATLVFYPIQSFAQDVNPWGSVFDCAVDWFSQCKAVQENRTEEPTKLPATAGNTSSLSGKSTAATLPLPVRSVLENPSPETARAYVTWSRQANEKLAKATEYIAQITRELNASAASQNSINKSTTNAASSLGPVGLYYFFSPGDQTALKDVGVLNKIFQDGKLGVVGIPVRGMDEEIIQFLNETKPLFPVRRSEAEVQKVKLTETPAVYLALPLQKKIAWLASDINEHALNDALTEALAEILRTTLPNRTK